MTIKEFKKRLKTSVLSPGAKWKKADFHVHLPSSHDYQYKDADAWKSLGNALEVSGLSYAVVLKHEDCASREELSRLQEHCPSVTLVPGVEINILVDALFKKIGKDYFFHCIVATDPGEAGEYEYVLRTAKKKYQYREGEYPSGFRSGVLDLGKYFRDQGALFIAAHLHQGKSADQSRSVDDLYDDDAFLSFIREGAFDALEVRQPATAVFFDGYQKTKDGLVIPKATCVASSDAHHHEHLSQRNRATWVRVERSTFAELKAALALPHRVKLISPSQSYPTVLGLHIVGTFLRDTWLNLNEGLNALIGSKGSGKTALLECLRFVLNTPVPKERADAVSKHLLHILGPAGYVECLVKDGSGTEKLIIRRVDSRDRSTVIDENDESETIPSGAPPVFPISILGWHEIESVADRASARIDILDRVGDPQKIKRAYDKVRASISHARDQLPLLQRQIRLLDRSLKELWELRRKRATLTRLAEGELSNLQDQYEWFLQTEQKLKSVAEGALRRRADVSEIIPSRIDVAVTCSLEGDLARELAVLEESAKQNLSGEVSAVGTITANLEGLQMAAETAGVTLARTFSEFRDSTYTPKTNELPQEDREILSKQIQVLEETKRLPTVEGKCAEQLREIRVLAQDLRNSCNDVCIQREEVVNLRVELIASLNKELPGIRLEFKRGVNREARDRFTGSYTAGASLVGFVDGYSGRDSYEKLRDLFENLLKLDLDQSSWEVKDTLFDAKLVDLLDVIDDDDVDLSLEVGKRGFVAIQNLSAGQRCVAVFPLLLRNSRGPLVIDQPEDNLDNRYIADTIGPDLLAKKTSQQYLVTSHNANLVVLTDADLIVHVDSDGSVASYPASGFLACPESIIRNSVLDVLDGGEQALLARQMKYGI